MTSHHLTATTAADRVAMIDRYLAEHPNGVLLVELKHDDSRSWREQMRDIDHREYMQVGVAGEHAAAQFVRLGLKHPGPVVHATYNPQPRTDAPRVPYDPELSWYFPAVNVISLAEVRQLMLDFALTGEWSHAAPWRDQENLVAAGR
jgi:hypothetical protein